MWFVTCALGHGGHDGLPGERAHISSLQQAILRPEQQAFDITKAAYIRCIDEQSKLYL